MGIFLADHFIAVRDACQMVSGAALIRDTCFVNAVTALPSGDLCAVIGMRAAMGLVIGLTFVCKEMFSILAFDFGANFFTRCCFGIALGVFFTCLAVFPFSKHTDGKRIVVTRPGIVCTFGFIIGLAGTFFGIAFFVACLDDLPFSKHAKRERVAVTLKCVFCTFWLAGSGLNIALGIVVTCLAEFPFSRVS